MPVMLPLLMRLARLPEDAAAGAPIVREQQPLLLVAAKRLTQVHLEALRDAEQVLALASAEATRIRGEARAEALTLKEAARAEGAGQGRRDAIVALLGTAELGRRLQELIAERLADVVQHTLRQLVGEPGDVAFMRRRIEHLLQSGHGIASPGAASAATLRCHPADFAVVRDAAAVIPRGLRLVADPGRPPGSLLLQLRDRFIESDLLLTLQQAGDLVRQAVSHCPLLSEGRP
jgi:flagellar biosynthesis/type III secretory pathway protein FliH